VTFGLPDGPVTLDADDVQVRLQAKPGWAAAQGTSCVVVLSTELSEELIAKGLARELVHTVGNRRKEIGCQYTDRIILGVVTRSEELRAAIERFQEYIRAETLALELKFEAVPGAEPVELKLAGHELTLYVAVAGEHG
jgi:isoleucyl-tRNA synthetase